MSSNKSARQKLEKLYGKKCMIEELGIRYIPKKERRKIKGYTKYDECLTFHHIKEKHNRWGNYRRKWCSCKRV